MSGRQASFGDLMSPISIIGAYLPVRIVAPCPFHVDQGESLTIDGFEPGDEWRCSACGLGGDAIHFVALVNGCSDREAAEILNQRYGPGLGPSSN